MEGLESANLAAQELASTILALGDRAGKSKKGLAGLSDSAVKLQKAWLGATYGVSKFTSAITSATGLGAIIGGWGISNLIGEAWGLMRASSALGDQFTYLQNSAGGVGEAMSTMYSAASGSLGTWDQMKSIMQGLTEAGVTMGDEFKALTKDLSSLEQMTGVSGSEWGKFTGSMVHGFGVSVAGAKQLTNALLATNLNASELQTTMGSVTKSMSILGPFAKNSEAMAKALTKGFGSAIAAMKKFGIETGAASQFMEKLMDPEQFEQNAALFAQLGVSAEDYFKAMENGEDSLSLMNKVMGNMPALADKLAAIKNPMARFNVAKQIGLPMEIASKMAGKTKEDIAAMMEEYQQKMDDEKVMKEKQEAAKANAAKWDEMMEGMKRQALAPLMGLIQKVLPAFVKMMQQGTKMLNRIVDVISTMLDSVSGVVPILGNLFDRFGDFIASTLSKFKPVIMQFGKMFVTLFAQLEPHLSTVSEILVNAFEIFTDALKIVTPAFSAMLWVVVKISEGINWLMEATKGFSGYILGGVAALYMFYKVFGKTIFGMVKMFFSLKDTLGGVGNILKLLFSGELFKGNKLKDLASGGTDKNTPPSPHQETKTFMSRVIAGIQDVISAINGQSTNKMQQQINADRQQKKENKKGSIDNRVEKINQHREKMGKAPIENPSASAPKTPPGSKMAPGKGGGLVSMAITTALSLGLSQAIPELSNIFGGTFGTIMVTGLGMFAPQLIGMLMPLLAPIGTAFVGFIGTIGVSIAAIAWPVTLAVAAIAGLIGLFYMFSNSATLSGKIMDQEARDMQANLEMKKQLGQKLNWLEQESLNNSKNYDMAYLNKQEADQLRELESRQAYFKEIGMELDKNDAEQLKKLKNALEERANAESNWRERIGQSFMGMFNDTLKWFGVGDEAIKETEKWMKIFGKTADTIIYGPLDLLVKGFKALPEAIKKVWTVISSGQFWSDLGTSIMSGLNSAWSAVKSGQFWSDLGTSIVSGLNSAWNAITSGQFWLSLGKSIEDGLKKIIDDIKGFFSGSEKSAGDNKAEEARKQAERISKTVAKREALISEFKNSNMTAAEFAKSKEADVKKLFEESDAQGSALEEKLIAELKDLKKAVNAGTGGAAANTKKTIEALKPKESITQTTTSAFSFL